MVADRVSMSEGSWLILAVVFLCVPLPWITAAVLAAVVHECGHYLALICFREKQIQIKLSVSSVRMVLPTMQQGKELICALSGPIMGLSLLLLSRWLPRTALCALGQSLFNLLPIYPLDGGRALKAFLSMTIKPPNVEKISLYISNITKFLWICVCIYVAIFRDLGVLPLIMAVLLLIRVK